MITTVIQIKARILCTWINDIFEILLQFKQTE